ncbi:MAG: molybdopterin dinucleotide binding domain-containing protein [Nocardioidaceae bacterium]
MAALRKQPEGVDLGPLQPSFPGRLQTPDSRVDLAVPLVLQSVAALDTDPATDQTDPDELLLIGRRHQRDNNSWMHNQTRLTKGRARHQLYIHPDDLAARGLTDGTRVAVASRVGKVEVEVAATEDLMPGVVSLPHGYGHRRSGVRMRNAVDLPGVSMNDLTDPERLDVSGNAVLTGVPVTVTPA